MYTSAKVKVRVSKGKSVLGRVRNCVGKRALCCEMVASSYVHQPDHSYVDFMFRLHSDLTRGHVFAGVLHSGGQNCPIKGMLYRVFNSLCPSKQPFLLSQHRNRPLIHT